MEQTSKSCGFTEAVARRRSVKKMLEKFWAKLRGKHLCQSLFLILLRAGRQLY